VTTLPGVIANASLTDNLPPVYDGLFNLALFLLLWRLRRRVTRDDALLYLYFAAYAFFRFWLEFIADYPPVAFGLTGVQLLCLAILAVQGIGLWRERARRRGALPAHFVCEQRPPGPTLPPMTPSPYPPHNGKKLVDHVRDPICIEHYSSEVSNNGSKRPQTNGDIDSCRNQKIHLLSCLLPRSAFDMICRTATLQSIIFPTKNITLGFNFLIKALR